MHAPKHKDVGRMQSALNSNEKRTSISAQKTLTEEKRKNHGDPPNRPVDEGPPKSTNETAFMIPPTQLGSKRNGTESRRKKIREPTDSTIPTQTARRKDEYSKCWQTQSRFHSGSQTDGAKKHSAYKQASPRLPRLETEKKREKASPL